MKIAGQKNDGAWFRANKAIHALSPENKASLAALLQTLPTATNAFGAIETLASELGVDPPASPANVGAWCSTLCTSGIPRQVWYGHLTFTTYTRSGASGSFKYTANYQDLMFAFAKDLRKTVINYIKGFRAINDLLDNGDRNHGNPGGNPIG